MSRRPLRAAVSALALLTLTVTSAATSTALGPLPAAPPGLTAAGRIARNPGGRAAPGAIL